MSSVVAAHPSRVGIKTGGRLSVILALNKPCFQSTVPSRTAMDPSLRTAMSFTGMGFPSAVRKRHSSLPVAGKSADR